MIAPSEVLLIRLPPFRNESARGYLLRISEQNGLASPRWLLSLLSDKGLSSPGYGALTLILRRQENSLSGLRGPIANLAQLNAADMGGLPMRYWNTRNPRFCPCCLAEAAHWKASWDLVFTVACEKHGQLLLDKCPQCQKPLSWDRPHLTKCTCGFDLSQAAAEAAPETAVQLAREIELRLTAGTLVRAGTIEILHALDLESFLRLVWLLGAYSRNAHHKPQKIVGLETIEVAGDMVEQAMSVLSNWPVGFHRLLEDVASRHPVSSSGNKLSASFGSFYRAIYKTFKAPEFDFLRAGFEGYVREHWSGQLARRNRRLSDTLRSQHEWVSTAEAVRLLKMRKEKVKAFIEAGILVGRLHETRVGRKMGVVRRDSLNALLEGKKNWISLKEARHLLGISRRKAYALLDQGVLNPIGGPTVDGQTLWCFQRQDVLAIKQAGT